MGKYSTYVIIILLFKKDRLLYAIDYKRLRKKLTLKGYEFLSQKNGK